jgi:Icc-related predicted phosphoesterase
MEQGFKFIVIADPHLQQYTVDGALARFEVSLNDISTMSDIDFILILGDICWLEPLEKLQSLISKAQKPTFITLGNNDMNRLNEYQDVFSYKNEHFFWHKNNLFVSLNSTLNCLNNPQDHKGNFTNEKIKWLNDTIQIESKTNTPDNIIFYSHVPPTNPYGSPFNITRLNKHSTETLFQTCESLNINACFFGHIHYDECFKIKGTEYITTPSITSNFIKDKNGEFPIFPSNPKGAYRIVEIIKKNISHKLIWL